MSPFKLHLLKWSDCQECELCSQRTKTVLFRGTVPCDVLFVGEAPGISEDVLGIPFTGPAGKLLDQIIKAAWSALTDHQVPGPTWGMTNLVACFPREAKEEGTNEPSDESIEACMGRLRDLVTVAKPKLIVCVGALATKWLQPREGSKSSPKRLCDRFTSIEHPASILRSNYSVQGLKIKKCVVTLLSIIRGL